MATTFAGDTIDGSRPDPNRAAVRPSAVVGIIVALVAILTTVAATLVRYQALLFDVACFGAIAAGVYLAFGPGPGLIAAGIAGLVVKDFGGR